MMLLAISARMFLAACSAQAGIQKKKTGKKPLGDENLFSDTMGLLPLTPGYAAGKNRCVLRSGMDGIIGIHSQPGV